MANILKHEKSAEWATVLVAILAAIWATFLWLDEKGEHRKSRSLEMINEFYDSDSGGDSLASRLRKIEDYSGFVTACTKQYFDKACEGGIFSSPHASLCFKEAAITNTSEKYAEIYVTNINSLVYSKKLVISCRSSRIIESKRVIVRGAISDGLRDEGYYNDLSELHGYFNKLVRCAQTPVCDEGVLRNFLLEEAVSFFNATCAYWADRKATWNHDYLAEIRVFLNKGSDFKSLCGSPAER